MDLATPKTYILIHMSILSQRTSFGKKDIMEAMEARDWKQSKICCSREGTQNVFITLKTIIKT